MLGSVHIVTRTTQSGKRYIVRFRRGGRGYPMEHAGSFKRQDLARGRERVVGGWLATGLDPRKELSKRATQKARTQLATVGREWLESRLDLAEQSRRVYNAYLDSLEASPLGHADPDDIAASDVRAQIARWVTAGLAPKSVHERVSVLRQVLDFADIDPNPARHRAVKLPPKTETELVLPTAEDVVALAFGLTRQYRLPFVILEQTAMRVGEAVSLERDDVDPAGLRFRVKAVNRKGRRGSRRPRSVPSRAG